MQSPEQVRQDQIREGQRRSTLSTSGSRDAHKPLPPKKAFVAKGHDAILKNQQDAGGLLEITTIGDGSVFVGKLVARDKYTITIEKNDGGRKTFYKHAIESFEPVRTQVQR